GWVSYTGRFHESAPPVRRNSSTTGFVLQNSKKGAIFSSIDIQRSIFLRRREISMSWSSYPW
ncbi:unnamed protein product, partial [Musa hybrid cultivar]